MFTGYSNIDRQIGFDLEGAEYLMKDIAVLHALPVALKYHKPDLFRKFADGYMTMLEALCNSPKSDSKPPVFLKVINKECINFKERVMKMLTDMALSNNFYLIPSLGPHATILHLDLWVNNTMQIMEQGKIVQNKFVDFQNLQYGNPMLDVVIFLFTSVQKQVVKTHLEHLIALYEERFFQILMELNCNVKRCNFLKELNYDAPKKLLHILFLIVPFFANKDDSAIDFTADPGSLIREDAVTPQAREQIVFVLTEFERRGWIPSSDE